MMCTYLVLVHFCILEMTFYSHNQPIKKIGNCHSVIDNLISKTFENINTFNFNNTDYPTDELIKSSAIILITLDLLCWEQCNHLHCHL